MPRRRHTTEGGLTGYLAHLNASTVPISITAVNWTSSNGDMWGFAFGALEHGLRGHISVIDSVATNTYNSGVYIFDKADSNLVSFKNCQFNSTCWSKYSHSHALSPVQISAREH